MVDDARAALQNLMQRRQSLIEELETEMKDVMPALDSASCVLDGLTKCDMHETKCFAKAPPGVEKALGAVLSLRCASQHSGVGVSCRQTSTRASVPLCAGPQGVCACYCYDFFCLVFCCPCVSCFGPSLQTRSSSKFSFAGPKRLAFPPHFTGCPGAAVHRLCTSPHTAAARTVCANAAARVHLRHLGTSCAPASSAVWVL